MGTGQRLDEKVWSELALRFQHARRSALRSVVGQDAGLETELDLLERAWQRDRSAVERAVFENSRALGRSFVRFYGTRLELFELSAALERLGVSCAEGSFSRLMDERALSLARSGSEACQRFCGYYTQALAGLVMGIGGVLISEREARVRGDSRCVHVLHLDPHSPHAFGSALTARRGHMTYLRVLA
jgi:hypothetical protein